MKIILNISLLLALIGNCYFWFEEGNSNIMLTAHFAITIVIAWLIGVINFETIEKFLSKLIDEDDYMIK